MDRYNTATCDDKVDDKFPVNNVEEYVGIAAFEALVYHSKPCSALRMKRMSQGRVEHYIDRGCDYSGLLSPLLASDTATPPSLEGYS
jgi:hypothetical protein